MGTYIVVTSGKGGTGKTTCTAALASGLAILGHRALCVDCDVGLRNLDMVLGLTEASVWDFSDILSGERELLETAEPHPEIEGLFFLQAPAVSGPEQVDPGAFMDLKEQMRQEFDYVLIDSPAGLGAGFRLASEGADLGIIVTTPELTSLRDGQRTAAELAALGVSETRLIVNRVCPRALRASRMDIDQAIDLVGARLLGVVSEDESIPQAVNLERPLIAFGAKYAYGQFMDMARRLTGERVPLQKRLRAD